MYIEQDAVMMVKLQGLWNDQKWGNVELLIDMSLRTYRKQWYSLEFIEDMELLRLIAKEK